MPVEHARPSVAAPCCPMEFDDLTYRLITDGRRLFAQWSDGTLLPVPRGGDGPNDDSDGDSGSGSGDEAGEDGDSGATSGDGSGDTGKSGETVTMSQADLDALVSKRLGRAKSQWEAEQKKAADRAKMDDADKAKAELADAQKQADDKVKGSHARLVKAEAKSAALAAGVHGDRVARFLRNVDLDDVEVDDDGEVDEKAVIAAVAVALKEVPEFLGGHSNGNGGKSGGASGGEFNGSGDKKVWTRAEVDKLSVADFDKYEAEIMAQNKAQGGLK